MMALVCSWGSDLSIGPTGDIAVAPVPDEIQHRIIRRLLTNSGDYVWHPGYGAGLGAYVGRPFSPRPVESAVLYHIKYETLVRSSPMPKVVAGAVTDQSPSTAAITIQYSTDDMPVGTFATLGLRVSS